MAVHLHRYDDPLAGAAEGRTHVGFLPGQPDDARIETFVLSEEIRVVALPADHPLARKLRLGDPDHETVVIDVVSGTPSLDLWEQGQRPATIVRVRNVEEWLEAIAAGRGVGLTPASTGRLYSHPQIRYRPVLDAPLVPVVLAWPRSAPHPLVTDFVGIAARSRSRR